MAYTSLKLRTTSLEERRKAARDAIERHRNRIAWAADTLIPRDPAFDMPSATEAGVIETYLPEALIVRDDMLAPFVAALEQLPEERPADPMGTLKALGAGFDTLSRTIAGAYFWSEDINKRLKYPGQQEIRETPDYDFLMAAIEPVMARGQRHISTP